MRYSYPAVHSNVHTNDVLSLRIARHSPCEECVDCPNLHPDPEDEIVLDDHSQLLDAFGSDDEDDRPPYLDVCACGHTSEKHGADSILLERDEFQRRHRAAHRLDELLHDVRKLLDFKYTNEDILSLRKQMTLPVAITLSPTIEPSSPALTNHHFKRLSSSHTRSRSSSILSDLSQHDLSGPPPTKRRRISFSSLSDEDEDDEDKPLAARMATKTGARGSKKSKSSTAPTSIAPPSGREQELMNGLTNGTIKPPQSRIKMEDRMDEKKIKRLATGVTVDTTMTTQHTTKPDKPAILELRKGVIHVTAVENDEQPRSLIILTGLKNLFQKQLPKMPREYIARLVYDQNSRGLAIIKRGYKVVGGICFRPFPHRGFAEIVFFATHSVDQVKGYGGMLMDHFKMHIKKTYPGMMHFLTYADNYAVGYFEKQGFSKEITLDRSVWAGYIKDYEGGTIMQCTMVDKIDYLDKANILAQQQDAILAKIREMSKSHVVYPGLPEFQDGAEPDITVDYKSVPGLRESGWDPSMIEAPAPRNTDQHFMERLLEDLKNHSLAWPFLKPVNAEEVPDYYGIITNPMDFSTMEHKLETDQYPDIDTFAADAHLVFDNCQTYNNETSNYAKSAIKMRQFLKDKLAERERSKQENP